MRIHSLSCCGMHLHFVKHGGGCGGLGNIYGCTVCRKKYMQISGGFVPTELVLDSLLEKMTDKEIKAAGTPIPQSVYDMILKIISEIKIKK